MLGSELGGGATVNRLLLSQQVLETRVQLDVVFAQVSKQLVCSQHFGNSHQLWSEKEPSYFQEVVGRSPGHIAT